MIQVFALIIQGFSLFGMLGDKPINILLIRLSWVRPPLVPPYTK